MLVTLRDPSVEKIAISSCLDGLALRPQRSFCRYVPCLCRVSVANKRSFAPNWNKFGD